ncbi:hypothetical protein ABZX93_14830 [Streptomyces sp. NPDC006632]|uniref:hypothetical protein n=1 Tax=Streptomyces sp. NPDC006632 TaxID=3157182 RepID=UPI0033B6AA19
MTVSMERPVRSMLDQHSLVDPYDEPHAKVRIDVVVSRDQLAAAVEMGGHSYYGNAMRPDAWTVEEIRYFAEFNILHMGALELQQGGEGLAELADPSYYDRETRAHVLAVYRAVDRAYPKMREVNGEA